LETAVGLAFDLVHAGLIDLERVVQMCSTNPARIFGLTNRGSLKKGAHADVTLLDPNLEWVFDVNRSKSKSRNTPFHGRSMHGAAVATIVGGRVVYLHPNYTRINEPRQRAADSRA
jgi:dihydroorotase